MKRTRKILIALLAIALLVPLFAAFEAHVINVKAHIENALEVSPKEVDFGVVFPQEELTADFRVGLSESFMAQDRVNDVFYRLVQRRKPKTPSDKLDVVFSFDLTGSMGGYIDEAKAEAGAMCDALKMIGPDLRVGVMSHVDYPDYYESYGYAATYGSDPDYAFSLDHPLDSDCDAVKTTINGLTLGVGGDGPQNYTRMIHEAWANPGFDWRADAQKVVIMFGDNVPHDDDLNAGVASPPFPSPFSTGGDPGADEVMFTGDDLDLQNELGMMGMYGIKLYSINPAYAEYWSTWTGWTGGMAVNPNEAGGVVASIEELFFYDDLRPYINKVSLDEPDVDTEAAAKLDKAVGDIEDIWGIDFYVPCIVGAVGMDYSGPIAPREADYGADIWVEVYGLSYADGTTWPPGL